MHEVSEGAGRDGVVDGGGGAAAGRARRNIFICVPTNRLVDMIIVFYRGAIPPLPRRAACCGVGVRCIGCFGENGLSH